MPPDRLWILVIACTLLLLCVANVAYGAPATMARFSASYTRKIEMKIPSRLNEEDKAEFVKFAPEHADMASRATATQYVEFSSGTMDVDNLNGIFRFNITNKNFSSNGVAVQSRKAKSLTTLLMYDVVLGSYNSSQLYRAGTNFTWISPNCMCSPITATSGGGSQPLLYLPDNATDHGVEAIVINKKTLSARRYTYTTLSFIPPDAESNGMPIPLPVVYTFYQSVTNTRALDRVMYSIRLKSGVESNVTMDFWQRKDLDYSSSFLPDTSCRKDCFDPLKGAISVRTQPASFYPPDCDSDDWPGTEESHTLSSHYDERNVDWTLKQSQPLCYCLNQTEVTFCNLTYAISSEIDYESTLAYAIKMKNLTVDQQPQDKLAPECAAQMVDFICKFYFPPCNAVNARMRPSIGETLNCFRESPMYFNLSLPAAPKIWPGEIDVAVDAPGAPIELPPSPSFEPVFEPIFEPIESPVEPQPTPIEEPPPPASQPPVAPPQEPPVKPIMSNASIEYAVQFAIFSSYNVALKKTITYPDIYTLKNWQIAIMLFGSIALILTIIVTIVMANRRAVSHYEKVSA